MFFYVIISTFLLVYRLLWAEHVKDMNVGARTKRDGSQDRQEQINISPTINPTKTTHSQQHLQYNTIIPNPIKTAILKKTISLI